MVAKSGLRAIFTHLCLLLQVLPLLLPLLLLLLLLLLLPFLVTVCLASDIDLAIASACTQARCTVANT